MLDFLGVNFLAIIYNLWLLTTKIMIGDKKKSHRNIVFFIHQNSDISECWIHVPQVNFVGEFGIHDFWRVRFGSQFSFGGKYALYVFGFHFIHTLNWVGVKGGGSIFGISLHFYVGISNFFPISDPDSHAPLPIYRMDSSNAYFDYLYLGSLFLSKKSIPDLEKKN